ncbi:MAG TPA: LUD domain-containing protein [Acidisarcina sp.]
MTESVNARAAILAEIRGNRPLPAADSIAQNYEAIPRAYVRSDFLSSQERVNLFESRLREYDANVYRAALKSLPEVIDHVLALRKKTRIGVPHGLPANWLLNLRLFVTGCDTHSPQELDKLEGVLTSCTVAIAVTGTIVLQHDTAHGPRKLSLVPDYHLCIVFAGQLVGTVPEAFDRLAPTATVPTTFISGPSATADIEMTRIKGVHGPRFLDVIVVVD